MHGDPNVLSSLVYFLWVPVCLYGMRSWPPAKATAVLFLGGTLLLPELITFRIPGIPEFDKTALINLWILIGALVFRRDHVKTAPIPRAFKWCVALLLGGSVFTVFLNMDPLNYGSSYIEAHRPYDVLHLIIKRTLASILPFYLGLSMFRNGLDLRVLLKSIVAASLLYSVLQIGEMVLSPQFNRWIYGYHQHSFLQTVRSGGYRPMVFMSHGLALALFTALAIIAATALHKAQVKVFSVPAKAAAGYLGVVLVASRSVAAFLYAFAVVPLVLFVSPRRQALVALLLVSAVLAYPAVRAFGLIPIDQINAIVLEQYGADKVGSLAVRFENEAAMLDRALERIWFGWGWFCRACLYDPWNGALLSIRDGAWIAVLGNGGIVAFIGRFGLLLFPVVALFRRISRVPRDGDRRLLAGLALMVGISAFDLIPNSFFNSLGFLLAGALSGSLLGTLLEAAEARRRRRAERARQPDRNAGVVAT